MEVDRRAFIASLGGVAAVNLMDHEAKAEALEHYMEDKLDEMVAAQQSEKFPTVAEIEAQIETRPYRRGAGDVFTGRGKNVKILEKMPDKPTLQDFFRLRFAPANHVLQSATRAMKTGMSEEIILACLLHDCVLSLIKPDHGWWGAQLFEPYIPEKSAFAIRYHQTLRFYADDDAGYEYPDQYLPDLRARLSAAAVHRRHVQDAQEPQVVHGAASRDGERPLRVRPEREGVDRAVRGHHRPPLQAAEGRPRLRQQLERAHVAYSREAR